MFAEQSPRGDSITNIKSVNDRIMFARAIGKIELSDSREMNSNPGIKSQCQPGLDQLLIVRAIDNQPVEVCVIAAVSFDVPVAGRLVDGVGGGSQLNGIMLKIGSRQFCGKLLEDPADGIRFEHLAIADGPDAGPAIGHRLDQPRRFQFAKCFADRRLTCIKFACQIELHEAIAGLQ